MFFSGLSKRLKDIEKQLDVIVKKLKNKEKYETSGKLGTFPAAMFDPPFEWVICF